MSKGKGKLPAASPQVMVNPATGSANPAASLSALWAYLLPALNHIVKSGTDDPNGKAPAIDVSFYSGIHTACYNYFTAQSEAAGVVPHRVSDPPPSSGSDLYQQLDKYFTDTTRELALGAPSDDADLVYYLVPCFNRYTAGAQAVNRLLNYVNRHYVKRAVEEDKGWLRLSDVLEPSSRTVAMTDTREKLSKILKEKRVIEVRKWGCEEGASADQVAATEGCLEAASALDRIVPIASLAHRRFRTELIEPLLLASKIKSTTTKTGQKIQISTGPRRRLARAVKDLLEVVDLDEAERQRLVTDLAQCLRTVGVRPEHPLRQKLDKLVASYPPS